MLTPSEMLAAVASLDALAWKLANQFHAQNPIVPALDLHDVAVWAFKVAALKFDPARGCKFITPATTYARFALIDHCRRESARGMHVPTTHDPYFAPVPVPLSHGWQAPANGFAAGGCSDPINELGEDFWKLVGHGLTPRERRVVVGVFREGKRQIDVAQEIGVTRARVGQLLEAAMVKLRKRTDLKRLAGMEEGREERVGKRVTGRAAA